MKNLFLASLVSLVACNAYAQQVIQVAAGESIQSAIDGAMVGDTIQVAEGVFNESLFINKELAIIGEGMFKTILTGGDNGSRAYLEHRTILAYTPVYLQGVGLLQGSSVVDNNHNTMGILLEASGGSTIKDCRIENHITGIYISGSKDNTITDNVIQHCGNGILFAAFLYDADDNTITNNLIQNNGIATETDDAGIKLIPNYTGAGNVITENDIVDNTIGINNLSSEVIDANGNWWGDPDGPQNNTNPDGSGNPVSGNVLFENWSDAAMNNALSIETISTSYGSALSLYPNPTRSSVNLVFEHTGYADFLLVISDVHGREVLRDRIALAPGEALRSLDVSGLQKGLYLVYASSQNATHLARLVIQ